MSALGSAFLSALALQAGPLADLRVGQDAVSARVEVVCGAPCEGTLREGGVDLRGVSDTLDVALDGGPLDRLLVEAAPGGARLTWRADAPAAASLTPCGDRRVCVDLTFAADEASSSVETADAADCAAAEATVAVDAWALDAFRDLALCRAAAGRLAEAAGMLDRLARVRDDEATRQARAEVAARLAEAQRGG